MDPLERFSVSPATQNYSNPDAPFPFWGICIHEMLKYIFQIYAFVKQCKIKSVSSKQHNRTLNKINWFNWRLSSVVNKPYNCNSYFNNLHQKQYLFFSLFYWMTRLGTNNIQHSSIAVKFQHSYHQAYDRLDHRQTYPLF